MKLDFRLLLGVSISSIASAGCSAAAQGGPGPSNAPLELRAGVGTLGQADAQCLRCGSWLRLQVRSDCDTTGRLLVTLRSGGDSRAHWSGPAQRYDSALLAGQWQSLIVDVPNVMPRDAPILTVNVRAYCKGKSREILTLKNGDTKCRLL